MSYSYKELNNKSDEDLIKEHDELARSTVAGVDYFLQELRGRRIDKFTRALVNLTYVLLFLTVMLIGIEIYHLCKK